MAARKLPDLTYLRECLDYNPRTGAFRWRVRPVEHFQRHESAKAWNARYAGARAGGVSGKGYLLIRVDRVHFYAQRLAWLLIHGDPVPDTIDHRDGDKLNNRICNLRAASISDNRVNSRMPRNSGRLIKGVYFNRGVYQADITRHGKRHWLGRFTTLEEAVAARQTAAKRLHGAFVRHD